MRCGWALLLILFPLNKTIAKKNERQKEESQRNNKIILIWLRRKAKVNNIAYTRLQRQGEVCMFCVCVEKWDLTRQLHIISYRCIFSICAIRTELRESMRIVLLRFYTSEFRVPVYTLVQDLLKKSISVWGLGKMRTKIHSCFCLREEIKRKGHPESPVKEEGRIMMCKVSRF